MNKPSGEEDGEVTHIDNKLLRANFRSSRAVTSSFAYVQAAGLLRLGPLVNSSQFHDCRVIGYGPVAKFTLDPSSEAAADAAEWALRSIGLTKEFAPMVVFVSHEARVTNDAQSGLLQCAMCGGNDGAMNARALASLLNETPLRNLLARRGIELPPETVFWTIIHDTTGDTVTLFVTGSVGHHDPQPINWLYDIFDQASERVRAERSIDLPATRGGGALYA